MNIDPMNIETLTTLREAANKIVKAIKRGSIEGPINWGSLYCSETRWILSDTGQSYAEVIIEEASPDENERLCYFVSAELEKLGYFVTVTTEW